MTILTHSWLLAHDSWRLTMTLITLVQGAQDLISGMPRCSSVIGNTDPQVRQLLALAHEVGRTLVEVHPWTQLTTRMDFTTIADTVQTDFLPSDFDRFVDQSMWNETRRMRVNGPLTPQELREMRAMATAPSISWFTRRGSDVIIYPTPPAGETIVYDYISRNYCFSAYGVGQSSWMDDTDIGAIGGHSNFLADERLYRLCLVWMWKSSKGLDFSTELSSYQLALDRKIAADGGRRTLNAAGTRGSYVQPPSTPDGSWSL